MAAVTTRPFSAEPMDLAADAHPAPGDIIATLMELPEWRVIPGQLWERVAESKTKAERARLSRSIRAGRRPIRLRNEGPRP